MSDGKGSPHFSVVMAVHNGLPYLAEAIESVLAQTEKDWELVIVDDASDDGTEGVLASFAARDTRIRLLRNPVNLHISRSLNLGIERARAPWVAHLDADDRLLPGFLERVRAVSCEAERDGACFVSTWVGIIDEAGTKLADFRLPSEGLVERMMTRENFLFHVATAFPKDLWRRCGGYPEELRKGVDRALWLKFFAAGARLTILPEYLAEYRVHDANLTSLARRSRSGTPLSRQQREWKVSIFLRQGLHRQAREELRLLAGESGWSLKNRAYHALSCLPRPLVWTIMWRLRPLLRRERAAGKR